MSEDQPEPPTPAQLAARLEARVQERRRAGEYPAELEATLEAHFRRVMSRRPQPYEVERLQQVIAAVEQLPPLSPERISYDSGLPAGSAAHRAIGRVVARQTAGVLEQVREVTDALRAAVVELSHALQHPEGHAHRDLASALDAVLERLQHYERSAATAPGGTGELERRVRLLEEREALRAFHPPFDAGRFDEFVTAGAGGARPAPGLEEVVSVLAGLPPVVHLGCGRGELVQLLVDRGVEALGVEPDGGLASAARERGVPVEQAAPLAWLERQTDHSLGGVALVRSAERLEAQELLEVLASARQKLRPGGVLVVEGLNVAAPAVHAERLLLDPRARPVHPEYVAFALREIGFGSVELSLRRVEGDADASHYLAVARA